MIITTGQELKQRHEWQSRDDLHGTPSNERRTAIETV